MKTVIILTLASAALLAAPGAQARNITTGIAVDRSCGEIAFRGRVVRREFADNAMALTGFVVEAANGARTFVNISVPDSLGRAQSADVTTALQKALKEGRTVSGVAQACGSGPVLTLERLQ